MFHHDFRLLISEFPPLGEQTMKKMRLLPFLLPFILILSGCALNIRYTPGSVIQGGGKINIEKFRYMPAETDLRNINRIRMFHFSENIDTYFTNAIMSEFKYAGYKLNEGNLYLTGDIVRFTYDMGLIYMYWELKVRYVFFRIRKDDRSKIVLLEREISVRNTPSMSPIQERINGLIIQSFDSLMKNREVSEVLNNEKI